MVVRTAVGATDRVHGIDTTVIVVVFSRLHGGNNAAVLRAMSFSTSSRSMITPTRLFLKVFVRILRYSFNQIHTIHNSFEKFQPIFPRLHYLGMYMKHCSSIESNMPSSFTSWHSMTTPTKFFESSSGRDELNIKWVY